MCLFAAAAFTPLLHAQASINGMLHGPDGRPFPDAEVTLMQSARELARTTADGGGNFQFTGLEPGEYALETRSQGHVFAPYKVVLAPRQSLTLMVELAPVTKLEQHIEVVGMSPEIDPGQTSSTTLISRTQLASLPEPERRNLPTLAQDMIPGAILSHDNFVHVRGNELSLHQFINGVAFLDNSHQQFSPGLSLDALETMNFITGGFNAEFANRFGGVVDETTRSGPRDGTHGKVELGGNSFAGADGGFTAGGSRGRLGWFVQGGSRFSDRYLNTPEPIVLHDRGKSSNGFGQLDFTTGRDTLKLLVFGGVDRFELPNTAVDQSLGRNAERQLKAQSAIFSWQHVFSDRALLLTSAYERTVSDRVFPTADPITEFTDGSRATLTAGVKSDFSYLWGKHLFKAGVDLTRLRLLESLNRDPRDPLDELGPINFQDGMRGGMAAVYVQDHYTPFRDLTFDLGLRFDRWDLLRTYNMPSPRAAIAYHINASHTVLHFAYDRLFSPPPVEYYLLASYLGVNNPDPDKRVGTPRPYRQSFYEAGLTQQVTPKTIFELTLYKHRGQNSFENAEIGGSRIFGPQNNSFGTSEGVEARFKVRQFESRGIYMQVQYAASRTYAYAPFTGGIADAPLPPGTRLLPAFDEIHTGSLHLTYQRKWRDLFTGVVIRGGSGTAAYEGAVRLPAHVTADFSTRLSLWTDEHRALNAEFDLENISGDRYQISKESEVTPIQYYPGRAVSGRIIFRF